MLEVVFSSIWVLDIVFLFVTFVFQHLFVGWTRMYLFWNKISAFLKHNFGTSFSFSLLLSAILLDFGREI